MKLQLYDAILNGSLQIDDNTDNRTYEPLSYLFSTTLDTKAKAEDVLTRLVRNSIHFDFSISDEADISMYLQADEYTEIRADDSDISITIPISEKTPQERYYNALMRTEAKRIKFTLIDYANTVKDNLRAREQVKDVLNQILKYIAQAEETQELKQQPDDTFARNGHAVIYSNLISALTSLYFELTIIFEEILPPSNALSLEDFFSRRQKNQSVPDEFRHNYVMAQLLHSTLLAIRSDDAELISKTLLRNYEELPKIESKNFREATERLENHYYIINHNNTADDTDFLIEPASRDDGRKILHSLKDEFANRTMSNMNSREILKMIDEELSALFFFTDNPVNLRSIPRDFIAFLKEQEEMYKHNISAALMTSTTDKSIKPKKKASKSVSAKISNAYKHINFFSGENNNGIKIMSEQNFAKLQEYIQYFYMNGVVPRVESRLSANIPITHIRYTFYLIKKENEPGRSSDKTELYANFLKTVFVEFKDTALDTIIKKFAERPNGYFGQK